MKKGRIYIVSIAVGAFTGLICVAFRYTVAQITLLRPLLFNHKNPLTAHIGVFLSIFLALLVTGWLVKKFPKISGSGLPQTQALMSGRRVYNSPFKYLVVKFIGGLLTLCSGLSLGREGTSVQMGSLTGYVTSTLLKIPQGKRSHLIAAGAGAGVAAAFTAPLSSSILIMESLQKMTISTTLVCTLLAGTVAGTIAKVITPYNIYDSITVVTPPMEQWQPLLAMTLLALFFALAGKLFSAMLLKGKRLYRYLMERIKGSTVLNNKALSNETAALVIQAFALALCTWTVGLFFTDMIGGDQTFLVKESTIEGFLQKDILNSHILTSITNILILASLTIIIGTFTILSHASGYPGGIFLPMMTIGGLLGKLFYDIIVLCLGGCAENLSGYYILIGMSTFFIAVMRTPITGFVLISEMTGHYETFFPTLVAGTLVYYFTQLMGVRPLNDILYDFMIGQQTQESSTATVYIDIESQSYFCGRQISGINLPQECTICEVVRNKKAIPIGPSLILEDGDQVGIAIKSEDIERLYRSIVSLGH